MTLRDGDHRRGQRRAPQPRNRGVSSHERACRCFDRVKEEPSTKFAKDQLRSIIERIERLEEEKKDISDDIREVYAEAKGNGYDVKALRTIVRMRKQDAGARAEQESILETYMQALGML
jgi:uncharacterized protein (UPF0335 family)